MLCHVFRGLLPHFLYALLSLWLVSISQIPPFSCVFAWISCLALSCLAVGQSVSIYQPMTATHSHSVQKDHPTAFSSVHALVIILFNWPHSTARYLRG